MTDGTNLTVKHLTLLAEIATKRGESTQDALTRVLGAAVRDAEAEELAGGRYAFIERYLGNLRVASAGRKVPASLILAGVADATGWTPRKTRRFMLEAGFGWALATELHEGYAAHAAAIEKLAADARYVLWAMSGRVEKVEWLAEMAAVDWRVPVADAEKRIRAAVCSHEADKVEAEDGTYWLLRLRGGADVVRAPYVEYEPGERHTFADISPEELAALGL